MFCIAICDDEKIFREQMKEILLNYMEDRGVLYEVDIFESGEDFVNQGIEMSKYDIIFLDINMDQLDGIMTAKKIRENNKNMFIVFVTAFINYTLEGYKVEAFRYLLKDDANMIDSIYECLDSIHEKMNHTVSWVEFTFKEGWKKISLDRLLYIESNLHKLEFYVMGDCIQKYTLYGTLNKIEEKLEGNNFLRVHQSYLVNMRFIKSISRYKVVLGDKIELDIPRARYNDVKERFITYRGEV